MRAPWGILDAGLSVLHASVVLAILVLWLPKATRRFHLVLVGLTALSWFGLGLAYGMGYCFLTDWHWQLKRWQGETALPGSFIHHALTRWFGLSLTERASNALTGGGFALASGLSLWLNVRDWRRRGLEPDG